MHSEMQHQRHALKTTLCACLWLFVVGLWFFVVCLWFFVVGLWFFVVGLWFVFGSKKPQKLQTCDQKHTTVGKHRQHTIKNMQHHATDQQKPTNTNKKHATRRRGWWHVAQHAQLGVAGWIHHVCWVAVCLHT